MKLSVPFRLNVPQKVQRHVSIGGILSMEAGLQMNVKMKWKHSSLGVIHVRKAAP
jgi:hypothetical protein